MFGRLEGGKCSLTNSAAFVENIESFLDDESSIEIGASAFGPSFNTILGIFRSSALKDIVLNPL